MLHLWSLISQISIPVDDLTDMTSITAPIANFRFMDSLTGTPPHKIEMENPLFVQTAWECKEEEYDKLSELRYRIYGPSGHPLHTDSIDFSETKGPFSQVKVFEFLLEQWYYDEDGICQLSLKWDEWDKVVSTGRFAFLISHEI